MLAKPWDFLSKVRLKTRIVHTNHIYLGFVVCLMARLQCRYMTYYPEACKFSNIDRTGMLLA